MKPLAVWVAVAAVSAATPVPKAVPKKPDVDEAKGSVGNASPYWYAAVTFKGDGSDCAEIQVRMAAGEKPPSADRGDDDRVVWRLGFPFDAKKPANPEPDAPTVLSVLEDGKRTVGAQKYGLKPGQKYAFRVVAVDWAGKRYSLATFAGTAADR